MSFIISGKPIDEYSENAGAATKAAHFLKTPTHNSIRNREFVRTITVYSTPVYSSVKQLRRALFNRSILSFIDKFATWRGACVELPSVFRYIGDIDQSRRGFYTVSFSCPKIERGSEEKHAKECGAGYAERMFTRPPSFCKC